MELEHSFSVPVGVDEAWRILLDIERIGPCMPGATIESVDGDDFTGNVKVKLGPINLTYKGKASFVEKDEAAHRAVIDARGRDARGNGTAAAKVTATLSESGGSTTVRVTTDLDITGKPAQFGRGVMVDVGNKLIGQFADCLAATISGSGGTPAPAAKKAAAKAPAKAPAKSAAKKAATKSAAKSAAKSTAKAAAKKAPRPGPATDAPISGSAPQPTPHPASESTPESTAASTVAPSTGPERAAAAAASTPSFTTAAVPSAPEPDEEPSVNGHGHTSPARPRPEAEPIDLLQSAGPAVAKRLAPVLAPVAVAAVVVLIARRRRK